MPGICLTCQFEGISLSKVEALPDIYKVSDLPDISKVSALLNIFKLSALLDICHVLTSPYTGKASDLPNIFQVLGLSEKLPGLNLTWHFQVISLT